MKKSNKKIIKKLKATPQDNIVIVDFGNVVKWQKELGWKIGVKKLASFIKNFAYGHKYLRRFYYGSDYGQDSSGSLTNWSKTILNKAKYNRFELITKKVKYIHDPNYGEGFRKKCDFDVEVSTDLIREKENYGNVRYSGDGDFNYLLSYLNKEFNKTTYIFGARGHIGKELFDTQGSGVREILFTGDFEKYLNMERPS